jgi:hypothetical protein
MSACPSPQSSAHTPSYTPSSSARNHVSFSCPGITSIFPPSLGTHQEWATSDETPVKVTVVFTGAYSV